jgi:hypothetical protein
LSKSRSWRTSLPLDFFECQKNMGPINHLEGMDDRLLIHHENALFLTQDKTKLESDLLSVTLGAGDIFQFEPQEAQSARLGYAGTQHNLACVRTPAGYIFVDGKEGQIFIYKGTLSLMNEGMNTFFRDFLKLKENNPFIGNGFTIGYDNDYKRIMLTVKNKTSVTTGNIYYEFKESQEFIDQLVVGDLVYMEGRWTRFLGVNTSPWSCPGDLTPYVKDEKFNINENLPVGTLIKTLTGTNIVNAYIISGNAENAFSLDPVTLELRIANSSMIDFELYQQFALLVRGFNANGDYDNAVISIGIVDVIEAPVTGDVEVNLSENAPNATVVATVPGVDPGGLPLTFAITTPGVVIFTINGSTGEITVLNNSTLDNETGSTHIFEVAVSNGTLTTVSTVTIHVEDENEAPVLNDEVIYVDDTTEADKVVHTFDASDPEAAVFSQTLSYELLNASVPGVFTVNPDGTVVVNSALNAFLIPQYTLQVLVRDSANPSLTDIATLTINILYALDTIEFRPAGPACAGTTRTWANVEVYSTYLTAVVATLVNDLITPQTFQGLDVPQYADIPNHVGCGGATQHYLNVLKSVSAAKNDCTEGQGTAEIYYVHAGTYLSLVSQAAADLLAETDAQTNAQAYANANGECII